MKLYCGIDLHSNNHWLTLINEHDERLVEERLANDLSVTLAVLAPCREALAAIAVESTFYARFKIMQGFSDAWLQNPQFCVDLSFLDRLDCA